MRLRRLVFLIFTASLSTGASTGGDAQHSIAKRSEKKFHPRFQREDYQVLEGNTTLENLVCVIAGGDERFLSVFSARGPNERCSRFPCPPATEGEDYVAVSVREFFLKPGTVMCVDITLIDDEVIEGREFFLLALQDLHWGEILDTTVITIGDDDDPSFVLASQTVPEDVGVASLCVMGGIQTVTLQMELLDISTATTLPLTPPDFFLIGDEGDELSVDPDGLTCFQFTIIDDDLDEDLEEILVFVTPGNGSNATFSLGGVIKILDNDFSPSLEFSSYSVSEEDGFVEVCVTFRAAASTAVTAYLETQDGTAVDIADYLYYKSVFNISGGEKFCHTIQLVNNSEPEITERFKVLVTSSNSVARPREATIQVSDDDVLDFEGSTRRYFTREADIFIPICVNLLSGSTNTSIGGFIYTQPGSAKGDTDFRSIRARFVFNHTQQMCFNLVILQDKFPELQEEMAISLLTISNGFIFNSVSATLTIQDDDAIPCEDLTPPLNGGITFLSDGNNPGSVAVYACDRTFMLVGSSRRECQVNGVWTGTEPTCRAPEAAGLERNI